MTQNPCDLGSKTRLLIVGKEPRGLDDGAPKSKTPPKNTKINKANPIRCNAMSIMAIQGICGSSLPGHKIGELLLILCATIAFNRGKNLMKKNSITKRTHLSGNILRHMLPREIPTIRCSVFSPPLDETLQIIYIVAPKDQDMAMIELYRRSQALSGSEDVKNIFAPAGA